ncbi:MAG: PQQ-binding-like beta-propeller repeat protein [Pirellulales bacterium]|nr:PQQ-binding-like beta-propeller repeat protein [Pirellulales bacterium]
MLARRFVSAWGIVAFLLGCLSAVADDWPQWRGPTRDGVWREEGILNKFAAPQLAIRWRQKIGPGYNGPTVADGLVYVMDRQVEPQPVERVHCFDAATGEPRWNYSYDCVYNQVGYQAGPRAAVTMDTGKAYSLGTMGHLFCFDAHSGDMLWKKDLNAEYQIQMPIWGIAASPLIDGQRLILQIGGKHACVVALNKDTGTEVWKALDDRAQYSAPIIIQQAGQPVLVVWTGDAVVGLNPTDGRVFWREPMKPSQMPIGVVTPTVANSRLFVSSFYDGSLMLKLHQDAPTVERVWREMGIDEQHTKGLHCMIGTPILAGDFVYGVDSYGELRCLNADTGERIWESLKAVPKARWSTIHMVENGGRIFMFNERGELLIAKLSPQGFEELSRAKLIEPTRDQLGQRKGVCWSHPAFANRCIFARNDKEIVCVSLSAM